MQVLEALAECVVQPTEAIGKGQCLHIVLLLLDHETVLFDLPRELVAHVQAITRTGEDRPDLKVRVC